MLRRWLHKLVSLFRQRLSATARGARGPKEYEMSVVGRRIRDLRLAKGLAQPHPADEAGISKAYLWS